ncbi:DUF4124 domain-containing protein [Ferriphaselus sp. R-1]|uniref:DUF4124 domain-containing protein n=1 Tax=Ferriphaselus sp. R-1 TaxID=1485544 RepID=UPI000555F3DA|nr:DUF4124 domain-containing protein [Ferriphaselus sp. R-1]
MKLICLSLGLLLSLPAMADIYKSVDAEGRVTYSSAPVKGAKRLNLGGVQRTTGSARPAAPSDFPKIDGQTQRGRDDTRRKILEQERLAELGLLNEARAKLPASPGGRADVTLHEKNIEALDKELAHLR